MKKLKRQFAAMTLGTILAISISIAPSNASMVASQFKLANSNNTSFQKQHILAGSSINKQIRQNGRDARTKHNPNAAVIGQMLGGATSLDIGGLGRRGVSPQHYAFCVRKYGSYRFFDNTYLEFSGERTQCISPFYQGDTETQ